MAILEGNQDEWGTLAWAVELKDRNILIEQSP